MTNLLLHKSNLNQAKIHNEELNLDKSFEKEKLLKRFSFKSEHYEQNIALPKFDDCNVDHPVVTQVKVHVKDKVHELGPSELRSIINNCDEIEKIVVERISISEATRVSLLFEAGLESEMNQVEKSSDAKKLMIDRSYDLVELERIINGKENLKISDEKSKKSKKNDSFIDNFFIDSKKIENCDTSSFVEKNIS